MAQTKMHREIMESLGRIEAALGTQVTEPMADAPAESPEEVAARLEYDTYTVEEISQYAGNLTPAEREALIEYEKAHKARSTALSILEG